MSNFAPRGEFPADFVYLAPNILLGTVSGEQIKALYKRFKAMDKDNLGVISENSFLSIPELSMNPLCDRIIRVFNSDGHKLVSFKQFVMVLSVFTEKSSLEDKLLCRYCVQSLLIRLLHITPKYTGLFSPLTLNI